MSSFDDPALRESQVGVQLVGDDGSNTPPAHALARRGIVDNVRGYTLYGDYAQPNPPARIVERVADGEIDVAVVWGPLGRLLREREASAAARDARRGRPSTGRSCRWLFDIAMGVRKEDEALRQEIDARSAAPPRRDRRDPGRPTACRGSTAPDAGRAVP